VERALAAKGIAVTPAMSLGGNQAIKLAVAAGAGVAIVSRLTIGQDLKLGTLAAVRLSDLTIRRPLYRLHPRGRHVSPAVAAFAELLAVSARNRTRATSQVLS
jgi:DNA-binding transcriptional LysR family regulator